jgi:transposase
MAHSTEIETASAARLRSGEAWQDFCRVIAQAGTVIERFPDASDLERAEWFRFLTRLVRNGAERFVENCEPFRPRAQITGWRTSINVQMPDQDHYLTEFDAPIDLLVSGNRNTTPYFVLAAWSAAQPDDLGARSWAPEGFAGLGAFDPASLRTTAFLASDDMHFDEDGNFSILVSRTPPPDGGDWLELADDSVGLLLRVVHHRRDEEIAPTVHVERVDGAPPRPITASEASAGLAKLGQWVLGYSELVRSWWQDNFSQRINHLRFSRQTYLSNGGVADRHFAFGAWECPDDDALVVEFTPPECEQWIFQLCNIWHENLDNYEDGQGYINKFTAEPEGDGSVRIVVCATDPGTARNWVDPYGHTRGIMGLRFIKTTAPPDVTVYRLPAAELLRDGWAALATAAAYAGDHTD